MIRFPDQCHLSILQQTFCCLIVKCAIDDRFSWLVNGYMVSGMIRMIFGIFIIQDNKYHYDTVPKTYELISCALSGK